MQQLILFITITFLFSCTLGSKSINTKINPHNTDSFIQKTENKTVTEKTPENIALKFINSYIDFCNNKNESNNTIEWINSNQLTTKQFKETHQSTINAAFVDDPELGLGFDPILDAQDYPEKGFEIDTYDNKSNIAILKGIQWIDFKLTIKLVFENHQWLVDGCGIINLPEDKRSLR